MKPPILFLTQSFPPRPGPAARRLGALAQRAAREYERVFVLRLDRNYSGAEQAGVEVTALPARDLRSLLGGKGQPGQAGVSRFQPPAGLRHLRESFPFVLLTDDGGWAYRRSALAAARELIRRHGITTIFSSFRPWSDHLVARRLKRAFPELHWIADFRDLPVDPVRRDVWWPALQRRWGRWVIAAADEVWCVSEGQRAQLTGCHPTLRVVRTPLRCLPPALTAPRTERFTIVYTGSLYAELQDMSPLVNVLRQLLDEGVLRPEELLLQYCGKDGERFRRWTKRLPEACLAVHSTLAPAAAQKMQTEAQILLLLNWSAPGYYGVLTAKLWDYLAAGRPVLALVNGPVDPELNTIVTGADAGVVVGTGEQGRLRAWLTARLGEWRAEGSVSWRPGREYLRAFL